jgi:hypothetical protein
MLSGEERHIIGLIDVRQHEIADHLRKPVRFKTAAPPAGCSAEGADNWGLQAPFSSTLEGQGCENDTWEMDGGELERFPGSAVQPHRDLRRYAGIPAISIGPRSQTARTANEFAEIDDSFEPAGALAPCILRWCRVAGPAAD